MNKQPALWCAGCGLLATGLFVVATSSHDNNRPTRKPVTAPPAFAAASALHPVSTGHGKLLAESLAGRGHLWEPVAADPRIAQRTSMPIKAEAFAPLRHARPGASIRLDMSDRFPALDTTVTNDAIQNDGTRVTHLRVKGTPEGELIVQENDAAGFFLAQLYYEDDPVAYEFRRSDGGLVAKRHPVSNLICSMLGQDGNIVAMGLPEPEIAEARGDRGNGNGGGGSGGSGRTVSIADTVVTEGTGGSNSLTFTLTLSSSHKKNTITVDYATSDGSATSPDDFSAMSGTVTFPKRTTQQTVTIPIVTDNQMEPDETFTVTLSNPSGASLGTATATGTIVNDDQAPSITTANTVVNEGNSGTTTATFQVGLTAAVGNTVTVDYATADGTAFEPGDYLATSGTLTFLPGETIKTVDVQVVGDTDYEVAEVFQLDLSNAVGAPISVASAGCLIINDDSAPTNVPVLNSLPGATAVAYLDMDGETVSGTPWNGGNTIVATGIENFGTPAMTDIWKRVAEDFAPFDINVTTEESVYLSAPADRRIRCIITPDNEWYGSAGGVAYLNSFTWTGDTPCWVFSDMLSNNGRYISEACSHEIGHTHGLRHDGRTTPSEAYYQGHGTGETGWAPIMGVGYYRFLTQWSKGEYANADNTEDDLAIITGQNGFGYRPDDHSDTSIGATPLAVSGQYVSGSGLIENPADVDVYNFTITAAGPVGILVDGSYPSSNLDLLAEIRDANGNILASDNHPDIVRANPVATLNPGTYYLHVSGVGKGDPQLDGYTDYGSLGEYTVQGQTP